MIDFGVGLWVPVQKCTPTAARLADDHYSRRTIGSPQFMPPGQTLVLMTPDELAVFGWWRPDPGSGLEAMNGLDGWTCTIFRNTGPRLSSELILEARARAAVPIRLRAGRPHYLRLGPQGGPRPTPATASRSPGGKSQDGRQTAARRCSRNQLGNQLGNLRHENLFPTHDAHNTPGLVTG